MLTIVRLREYAISHLLKLLFVQPLRLERPLIAMINNAREREGHTASDDGDEGGQLPFSASTNERSLPLVVITARKD